MQKKHSRQSHLLARSVYLTFLLLLQLEIKFVLKCFSRCTFELCMLHTSAYFTRKKKGGAGGFRQDNNFYVHSSCVHPCTWNYPPNRKKGDQGRNDGRKNHLRCSRSVGHFCWEIPRGVGTDSAWLLYTEPRFCQLWLGTSTFLHILEQLLGTALCRGLNH